MYNLLENVKDFFVSLFETWIWFHESAFELVGDFSYSLQYRGLVWAIFEAFCGILMTFLLLFLDVCIVLGICILIYQILLKIRTKEIKRIPVIGTVTGKKHIKEHTSVEYNVALKMPMSHYHSAEYNVYVEYNGIPETFNSKKLFKKYKKNDDIPLILIQNLDKNKKVIRQKLELPE